MNRTLAHKPRMNLMPVALAALAFLAACSSGPRLPAPVENRGQTVVPAPSASPAPAPSPALATSSAEAADKPGFYTVQRGDTLTRIGLDQGQAWRDLARWNQLSNPDVIEVGQVLRVAPPGAAVETSGVVVRPVGAGPAATPTRTGTGTAPAAAPLTGASAAAAAAAPVPAAPAAPAAPVVGADELNLAWPAQGVVSAKFDEAKNKGIDIAGKAGDPVLAAADGQVVYAGSGLRGYGQLLIVKHSSTYLTAYAHNQKLLVKEDQRVRRGDKIAEMGSTDTDQVKLHFEVRRQGKPVDPLRYLSAR